MEPDAWMALTGTAGSGEGCNRPFWLRHEAVAYVRQHGGYIRPLFAGSIGPYGIPLLPAPSSPRSLTGEAAPTRQDGEGEESLATAINTVVGHLTAISGTGQSVEPDHWQYRCMARSRATEALKALEALSQPSVKI